MTNTSSTQTDKVPEEGLEWSMAAHLQDVAKENSRSPWPDIIAKHGSLDAWFGHCRTVRKAEYGDEALVRAIVRLMNDAPGRPQGTLLSVDRDRLLADREVAAYFASVAASGDRAWEETRRTARNIFSVRSSLPTWRQWGAILLEAGAIDDLDSMFVRPEDRP